LFGITGLPVVISLLLLFVLILSSMHFSMDVVGIKRSELYESFVVLVIKLTKELFYYLLVPLNEGFYYFIV